MFISNPIFDSYKKRNNDSVEGIEFSFNVETDEIEVRVVKSTPIKEN